MEASKKKELWLKTPVGSNILAQIGGDPGLPRPNPTISSWQIPAHPALGHIKSDFLPQTTDYLIIGSGVTGCGAAKTLLDHPASGSKTVTVLDARGLCSGATGRNGGQLVKPYALRYVQLAEAFGVETATKVARLALHTLEEMHKLAASYDDELAKEANARRVTKCIVYMDKDSWSRAQRAVEFYEKNLPEEKGLFQLMTKAQIEREWNVKGGFGGFKFPAGVCWPYRLITGVFKRLQDKYPGRLNIETHTPATQILYDEQSNPEYPYMVVTPRGIIRAGTLIHCTNGHTGHLLPRLRGKIHPIQGTMSAQDPGKNFPDLTNTRSWTFLNDMKFNKAAKTVNMGWFYGLQNPPNCDVWIGGDNKRIEDVFTADDSYVGVDNRANLSSILTTVFNKQWVPKPPNVRRIWTGVMAQTGDTLPFVGQLPSSITERPGHNEWIAAGWNSYGMTNGLTCGEAVARMILGEEPPAWFPTAYLPTEERLHGHLMTAEAATSRFLENSGIGATLDVQNESRAKL